MPRVLLVALVVLWLSVTTGGYAYLLRYKAAPGEATRAPGQWPVESRLTLARDRATLLVFVHPKCSCSRATLSELGRLLPRVEGRVSAQIVLVRPRGAPAGFEKTALRDTATAIRGAVVIDDPDAAEAGRFGAATSGAALLYQPSGRLEFAGGITALRGHEGNNLGEERLLALLTGGQADRRDSPVFGCELSDAPAGVLARSHP